VGDEQNSRKLSRFTHVTTRFNPLTPIVAIWVQL